jgi:hypothetical protein
MWHVCGRGEVYTGVWWGNLRKIDHLGDPGANERTILRSMWGVWTRSSWLRIGTGGGHL